MFYSFIKSYFHRFASYEDKVFYTYHHRHDIERVIKYLLSLCGGLSLYWGYHSQIELVLFTLGISVLFYAYSGFRQNIFKQDYRQLMKAAKQMEYEHLQDFFQRYKNIEWDDFDKGNDESFLAVEDNVFISSDIARSLRSLGLPLNTRDFRVIKRQYRHLMRQYHPDKNQGEDTKAKQFNSAYDYLSRHKKQLV